VAAAAVAVGAGLGPVQRARIFHHTVPTNQPWRRRCPHCRQFLVASGWRGVTSVLPSTGACPHCRQRIGPAPFTVEVLTVAVLVVLALRVDRALPLAACCWIAVTGVALGYIDIAVHRLPDQLTVASLAGVLVLLGAAALVGHRPGWILAVVLNGIGLAAVYLVLIALHPAGMGLGDAKLALSLGCLLGWFGWEVTVYGAAACFVLAGLWSLLLLASGRATAGTRIPHGPFLILGSVAAVVLAGS